ncbi:MAG: carbon-nitrogen hydrolase family protein [Fimbriimonadaceae bacterium]|nr:carbon-nitrogen hydrolase family protein [Fimbriimonadaceae bacterium]QYK59183.1 MAG: carbon-nitrogen hydrolase family protein [Fimbriimonadaceae bacterium]
MRIACAQLPATYGALQPNLDAALRTLTKAQQLRIDLVVFPECFLTGYCVPDREEAERIAVPLAALEPLEERAKETNVGCVVGFAESDGTELFNAAALIEPGERPWVYRKTHLPELGLDKHVKAGDMLEVCETRWGRIGVLICFDLRHPEPSRCLAVQGADLIVLPTNWPEGAYASPQFIAPARAAENKVFVATCNRPDEENGYRFIGKSGIYDVGGNPVAIAGQEETLLVADIDLPLTREKRTVVRTGEYEIVVLDSRRPELYGPLTSQEISSRV